MSQPIFAYASDVSRIRRERLGVDKYGNDVLGPVTTVITGAVTWPEERFSEIEGERDTVESGLMVLLPVGVGVAATDKFLVGQKTYQVDGEPADYSFNPFTSSRAGTLVRLRRITG